jgi:hypothetical protein
MIVFIQSFLPSFYSFTKGSKAMCLALFIATAKRRCHLAEVPVTLLGKIFPRSEMNRFNKSTSLKSM